MVWTQSVHHSFLLLGSYSLEMAPYSLLLLRLAKPASSIHLCSLLPYAILRSKHAGPGGGLRVLQPSQTLDCSCLCVCFSVCIKYKMLSQFSLAHMYMG